MSDGLQTLLRVVVVDDHRLIVKELRRVLDEAGGFEVVGEAVNGREALVLVSRHRPDVVLLDLRMPGMDGLACLDQLRKKHPEVKVVMLSVASDRALVDAALARGACGWVVKTVDPGDLPGAVRQAIDSGLNSAVGLGDERKTNAASATCLTQRELLVLTQVARGSTNAAIARELGVTAQTVKFHLTNVYRKLQVSNRTEAALYAYERAMVDVHPFADGLG